jgi:predicted transcriptional regulator
MEPSIISYSMSALVQMGLGKHKPAILKQLVKKDKITISELQRALKISYKETYRNIKELEKWHYVLLTKNSFEKCQPVRISINPECRSLVDGIVKEIEKK